MPRRFGVSTFCRRITIRTSATFYSSVSHSFSTLSLFFCSDRVIMQPPPQHTSPHPPRVPPDVQPSRNISVSSINNPPSITSAALPVAMPTLPAFPTLSPFSSSSPPGPPGGPTTAMAWVPAIPPPPPSARLSSGAFTARPFSIQPTPSLPAALPRTVPVDTVTAHPTSSLPAPPPFTVMPSSLAAQPASSPSVSLPRVVPGDMDTVLRPCSTIVGALVAEGRSSRAPGDACPPTGLAPSYLTYPSQVGATPRYPAIPIARADPPAPDPQAEEDDVLVVGGGSVGAASGFREAPLPGADLASASCGAGADNGWLALGGGTGNYPAARFALPASSTGATGIGLPPGVGAGAAGPASPRGIPVPAAGGPPLPAPPPPHPLSSPPSPPPQSPLTAPATGIVSPPPLLYSPRNIASPRSPPPVSGGTFHSLGPTPPITGTSPRRSLLSLFAASAPEFPPPQTTNPGAGGPGGNYDPYAMPALSEARSPVKLARPAPSMACNPRHGAAVGAACVTPSGPVSGGLATHLTPSPISPRSRRSAEGHTCLPRAQGPQLVPAPRPTIFPSPIKRTPACSTSARLSEPPPPYYVTRGRIGRARAAAAANSTNGGAAASAPEEAGGTQLEASSPPSCAHVGAPGSSSCSMTLEMPRAISCLDCSPAAAGENSNLAQVAPAWPGDSDGGVACADATAEGDIDLVDEPAVGRWAEPVKRRHSDMSAAASVAATAAREATDAASGTDWQGGNVGAGEVGSPTSSTQGVTSPSATLGAAPDPASGGSLLPPAPRRPPAIPRLALPPRSPAGSTPPAPSAPSVTAAPSRQPPQADRAATAPSPADPPASARTAPLRTAAGGGGGDAGGGLATPPLTSRTATTQTQGTQGTGRGSSSGRSSSTSKTPSRVCARQCRVLRTVRRWEVGSSAVESRDCVSIP